MITIACVMKSGGEYGADDVRNLRRQVAKGMTIPYRFQCLTDRLDEIGDCAVALHHGLRGWWSKLELFSLHGPVLYLDLDTAIVGSLDELCSTLEDCSDERIYMLRSVKAKRAASGVMAWTGDFSWILDRFLGTKKPHVYTKVGLGIGLTWENQVFRGDQDAIRWILQEDHHEIKYIQDSFDGVYSFKNECGDGVPSGARIVYFHGRPKPKDIGQAWAWSL